MARAAFSVSGAVRSMSISSSSSDFLALPALPFSSGPVAWLVAGDVLVLSSLITAAGQGAPGAARAGEAKGPQGCVDDGRELPGSKAEAPADQEERVSAESRCFSACTPCSQRSASRQRSPSDPVLSEPLRATPPTPPFILSSGIRLQADQ